MSKKTRVITLSALFSALSFISLYFASVWPTGRYGLVAFSSLFVAGAVCEAGIASGVYVFIVGSALGMLLLPDKSAPVLYVLFFGYYPVLKSLIERVRRAYLQWILKLLVFNAAFMVLWFLAGALVFGSGDYPSGIFPILIIGLNLVFALFDYGFSKVIRFYVDSVSKYTGRN